MMVKDFSTLSCSVKQNLMSNFVLGPDRFG